MFSFLAFDLQIPAEWGLFHCFFVPNEFIQLYLILSLVLNGNLGVGVGTLAQLGSLLISRRSCVVKPLTRMNDVIII